MPGKDGMEKMSQFHFVILYTECHKQLKIQRAMFHLLRFAEVKRIEVQSDEKTVLYRKTVGNTADKSCRYGRSQKALKHRKDYRKVLEDKTIKDEKGQCFTSKGLPKSNVLKYNLSDEKTYFKTVGNRRKKLYLGTFAESFGNSRKDYRKSS